ncbi:SulP family inorganic anion transporter [Methylicorpusculum sp.]|uniref:SulP family inorganic anion transporter n=2 Tax=Methylicorpusculum sp. TaxID=2713644 RepID=UPI00272F04F7|nr:SulP family inorganic anion transporter [Methylicorpusculum sp.]MDP2179969.1 SulP family inorganic anion transporter [Methylicorpusculum sp.]MDP3530227.1 SulP family inorganic anion transporter [Methylicorpusculum sp.]
MSSNPLPTLPKTGLLGLKTHWRADLPAGFLVFLIALPLCLGISMASGFPPSAGIISAIVGGILVSRIGGSHLTINGPAAGLIVVVLDAVQTLGQGDYMAGYRFTLAAIVVASLFQIVLGLMKAGRLRSFFPASVVHGMLAAIGIIIMTKQIHVMMGVTPKSGSLFSSMAQLPSSLINPNYEIAIIGLTGLAILVLWSVVKHPVAKRIPAPILVVLSGMALGRYFDLNHEHVYLFLPDADFLTHHEDTVGPKFLVTISENFLSSFYFPDFSKIGSIDFWRAAITIALVGSLESLLSAAAVDKLDPFKRTSNPDRDLTAMGMGNLIAGSIGGLPMIAEIVRSSANINDGAKTAWANFFHGCFMLLFVVLFPRLIHSIPLAALASLLVYTGFRLASPTAFAKVMGIGKEQLLIFVATIIGVLATDLLIGVFIGILAEFAIHLVRGVRFNNLFKIHLVMELRDTGEHLIGLTGAAIFSNYMPLKSELESVEKGKTIILQLNNAYMLDHTVMEYLHDFKNSYETHGGHCRFIGMEYHDAYSAHPLAVRKMKRNNMSRRKSDHLGV